MKDERQIYDIRMHQPRSQWVLIVVLIVAMVGFYAVTVPLHQGRCKLENSDIAGGDAEPAHSSSVPARVCRNSVGDW